MRRMKVSPKLRIAPRLLRFWSVWLGARVARLIVMGSTLILSASGLIFDNWPKRLTENFGVFGVVASVSVVGVVVAAVWWNWRGGAHALLAASQNAKSEAASAASQWVAESERSQLASAIAIGDVAAPSRPAKRL